MRQRLILIKEYNSEQGERGISLSALLWLAVSKTFCFGHSKVKQLLFHFQIFTSFFKLQSHIPSLAVSLPGSDVGDCSCNSLWIFLFHREAHPPNQPDSDRCTLA